MLARNDGDGTVGTMAVTALGYFDVGIVAGRCKVPFSVARNNVGLAQFAQKLLVVELAVKLVYLGYLLLQLVLIALRQASHDIEPVELAFLLALYKLKDGVYTLLFCILDKAARVDDGYFALRALGVVHTIVSVSFKLLHQQFTVHKVLGTPHGNYVDFVFLHYVSAFRSSLLE